MPWDAFCPICTGIYEGDMTEDDEEIERQWSELKGKRLWCHSCMVRIDFDTDEWECPECGQINHSWGKDNCITCGWMVGDKVDINSFARCLDQENPFDRDLERNDLSIDDYFKMKGLENNLYNKVYNVISYCGDDANPSTCECWVHEVLRYRNN